MHALNCRIESSREMKIDKLRDPRFFTKTKKLFDSRNLKGWMWFSPFRTSSSQNKPSYFIFSHIDIFDYRKNLRDKISIYFQQKKISIYKWNLWFNHCLFGYLIVCISTEAKLNILILRNFDAYCPWSECSITNTAVHMLHAWKIHPVAIQLLLNVASLRKAYRGISIFIRNNLTTLILIQKE